MIRYAFCLLLAGAPAISASAQVAQYGIVAPLPAIAGTIDEGNLVPLKGMIHPLATPAADRGVAPDSLEIGRTVLLLKRSAAQQKSLNQLTQEQQNPQSASYHKWLTPEQFGKQYGAAQQDIEKINTWLASHGLQVEPSLPGRNMVVFSGTHAQLRAAFHTELHSYEVSGVRYWANATNPEIPAALAPVIVGFSSLNNFPKHGQHTKPQMLHRDASTWVPKAGTTTTTNKLNPNDTVNVQGQNIYAIAPLDLATIYNLQPLWNAGIDGTGQTIAIVSDSDINSADVDYFRSVFGLPATKLNIIHYGDAPGPTNDEGEADLDVQWAGAVAKNATIDLVVAGNTATSAGIDDAAIYIIENNLASILNVSYGQCESELGSAGNQFYSEIWEQAAAQGITVTAAAGDSGSANCDQGNSFAFNGLTVSGISSTPYNVAIGGTDLYGSFVAPANYWSATNNPTTYQSALSYIPELPWNNSCGNPQLLAALQAEGVTDGTTEALCNDPNLQGDVLTAVGGGGGASGCATSDATTGQCLGGYPKPAWQGGLQGVPTDGVRDVPDISLMAGNGLWGSLYIYCQSDVIYNGQCDVTQELEGAGGTSFASPIFAGIMALVQQKTSSAQGNPNYILYKLAQTQFAASGASSCASSNVTAGNNCIFYDVDAGSNAVPCYAGTTNCTPTVPSDSFGVLPGYAANTGYDLATGIGSINFTNLVNGWQSAASTFTPTSTLLTATSTTVNYGSSLDLTVAVGPVSPATGTPTGDISIVSNSSVPNSNTVAGETLAGGTASVVAALLPGGTYQLFAHYTGDITFAPSESTPLTITIAPSPLTGLVLEASKSTIQPGQNVTLSVTVPGLSGGISPTGSVTFTDTTSGVVLGTAPLGAVVGGTNSVGYLTVSSTQLQSGSNTLSATYSGDANYSMTTASGTSVIVSSPFTVSINPSSVTIAPNSSSTATITVTPTGSLTLNPANLSFKCPTGLPSGLGCSFSAPVAGANGTVLSTLSLQTTSPLVGTVQVVATTTRPRSGWFVSGATISFAGLLVLGLRRRKKIVLPLVGIVLLGSLFSVDGCSNGSPSGNPQASLIATATTLSTSSSTPTLNAPVTLTARVSPMSGTGSPSGSMTFSLGTSTLGSVTVSSGQATLTTNSLPIGSQNIVATYSGDSIFATSTSSASKVDVGLTTTISVTASDTAGDTNSANLSVTVQ